MWGSAAHTLANTSSTGIDSANILINYIFKNEEYKVRGKYDVDDLIAQVKFDSSRFLCQRQMVTGPTLNYHCRLDERRRVHTPDALRHDRERQNKLPWLYLPCGAMHASPFPFDLEQPQQAPCTVWRLLAVHVPCLCVFLDWMPME